MYMFPMQFSLKVSGQYMSCLCLGHGRWNVVQVEAEQLGSNCGEINKLHGPHCSHSSEHRTEAFSAPSMNL